MMKVKVPSMIRRLWRTGFWLAALFVSKTASQIADDINLIRIVSGIKQPTGLISARDGSGRLFIVEKCARILILKDSRLRNEPFLDLTDIVRCNGGEEGLLGLAFHPDFSNNGYFFVNFSFGRTTSDRSTIIRRYSVSTTNPNLADRNSFVEVLSFSQPYSNHNGGDLAFGPDGLLYVTSGDGGSGGDPQNHSQSKDTLLGKILRLDVNDLSSIVPSDNPFVNEPGARGEIWVYGVRNPWKMSFDRVTGDLFFGDVGQGRVEEVSLVSAGSGGGENYGWKRMEGTKCFPNADDSDCFEDSLTLPIIEYYHGDGHCSITGGYRYRGAEVPELQGKYVYGDFCSGAMWAATLGSDGTWTTQDLSESRLAISAFGENERGELYVVDYRGTIYRLTSSSTNCEDTQGFFYNGNPDKTCDWILARGPKKRKRICRRRTESRKVKNSCPRACRKKCQ